MKKKISYDVNNKTVEREYNYIPFRYILAVMITLFEVAAIIGSVILLCVYVPYFYILCWITQIACVITIIASDDNPDYKVPWLLFVMILPIAGFIHAKSYIADDEYAMIGTINLDYRSLVHHFEDGVWMYNCESIKDLKTDILETLNKSIEITPNMLKTNLLRRFIRAVVRIFAPMM